MIERYARLFALPHARRLLLVEIPARLPIGLIGLAIVLFVREHYGSYASAGLAAGAFAAALGISNPILGRLVDRRGLRPVLIPACVVHAIAIVALVSAGPLHASLPLAIAAAALAGGALPPLGPVTRLIWPMLIDEGDEDPELFATALALESILIELVFATGPLLTAGISTLIDPAAALIASPLLLVIGLAGLLALPPVKGWGASTDDGHDHGPLGALRSRGLLVLMAAMLPLGFCFGSVEVTLPAFAEQHGDRALGGLLMAVWSLGSAIGGFTYGAIAWKLELPRRWARLAMLTPLAYAPLMLADSQATMAFLALLAGLSIAPVLTAGNQVIADVALPGTIVEAYVWPITTMVVGAAIGNAVAGWLVTHTGIQEALVASTLATLIGALIAMMLHPRLTLPALALRSVDGPAHDHGS